MLESAVSVQLNATEQRLSVVGLESLDEVLNDPNFIPIKPTSKRTLS